MLRLGSRRLLAAAGGGGGGGTSPNRHTSSSSTSTSAPTSAELHQQLIQGHPGGPYRPFPPHARRLWEQHLKDPSSSQRDDGSAERANDWVENHPAWANVAKDPDPREFVGHESKPAPEGDQQQEDDNSNKTFEPVSSESPPGSSSESSQQQQQKRTWNDKEEEARARADPSAYTSGHHQVRKWYKLYGLDNTLPASGKHPDFRLPTEADDIVPDEDIMRSSPNMNAAELERRQQRRGVQFFRAARKGVSTDDPFVAAFAPSRVGEANKERMKEVQRQHEQQQLQEEEQRQQEKSAVRAEEMNKKRNQQEEQRNGGSSSSSTSSASSPFSKFQVGGATVGEWRGKIQKVRARGEGNLVARLQGEIGFAHILSQTGQIDDARECLEVGDYVWKKLSDLKSASPGSEGSTHGVVINVCSAMKRAARTLGESEKLEDWELRLEESSRKMMEGATLFDPKRMQPTDMEPEKREQGGARKFKVSANAMWSKLRNPVLDQWSWAKKYISPNPDVGSRYTK